MSIYWTEPCVENREAVQLVHFLIEIYIINIRVHRNHSKHVTLTNKRILSGVNNRTKKFL